MQRFIAETTIDDLDRRGLDLGEMAVLELASGGGGYSPALHARARRFVATDLRKLPEFPDGVPFVQTDVTTLPFDDDTFDLIYCSSLIEHLDDPTVMLREAARVLRPGATLFLSFPPFWSLFLIGGHHFKPWHLLGERVAVAVNNRRRGESIRGYHEAYGPYGLHPLRIRDARRLLVRAGFEPGEPFVRFLPVNTARLPGLLADLLTWHVCFVAAAPAAVAQPEADSRVGVAT